MSDKLKDFKVRVTRLARGMPIAASIEYLDSESLKFAIGGRQEV